MMKSFMRILIIDAFPGQSLQNEIQTLIKNKVAVRLNINRFHEAPPSIYKRTNAFRPVDFNCEHHDALLRHVTRARCGFDILQSRANIPFTKEVIRLAADSRLKNPLKIIAQAGVGVDHIDCEAATEHGVIVTHTPGTNANAVAEFIITQMLALARNITFHNKASHMGKWSKGQPGLTYSESKDKTLGIVGVGHVASMLIPKALAFGMHVMGFGSNHFTEQKAQSLGIERSGCLGHLLARSDFISLNIPLTSNTRNLIGYKELKMIKRGAFLINTSRGGIVDEEALARELQSPEKNLAGAAIDTLVHEKSSYKTSLMGLDNVLLTPHIAGSSQEAL